MRNVGAEPGKAAGSAPAAPDDQARAPQTSDHVSQPLSHSSRVKTLAPPPPPAAFATRSDRPVSRASPHVPSNRPLSPPAAAPRPASREFMNVPGRTLPPPPAGLRPVPRALPKVPSIKPPAPPVAAQLAEPPESDWPQPARDIFASSLHAPRRRALPWGLVAAFAAGAVTVGGLVFIMTQDGRTDRAANARAHVQSSAPTQQVAPTGPAGAPVAPSAAPSPPVAVVAEPSAADSEARQLSKRTRPTAPPSAAEPAATAPDRESTRRVAAAASQRVVREPRPSSAPETEPEAVERPEPEPAAVSLPPPTKQWEEVIEDLPEQPTRDEIKRALEATRPALAACIGSEHGTTFANVTIAGSGRVTYSSIEGAFAGTPQGSCIARALRTASFPRFAAPSMKVRFPFVL
jgi:hypothetical protein